MASGRLAGRRLLVVGAGTRPGAGPDEPPGNGHAAAVLAAREGAAVACADLDLDGARATAGLIGAGGGRAVPVVADVADPVQCAAMVDQADAALGGLDGVVLNVGIGVGQGLAGTSVEDWDHVFAVNLRSHFLVSKAAAPRLPEGGALVYIGSAAGLRAGSGSPSYDASKAGLLGLCRHVATEVAVGGVWANAVIPGFIDTPMGRTASAGRPARERAAARIPLGRQGTAWEVAHATVFLLSAEASYITGHALVVDGGLTAR